MTALPRHVTKSRMTKRGLYLYHRPFAKHQLQIMGNELLLIVGFTIFSLVVTMAWVAGYLDKYQQYVIFQP